MMRTIPASPFMFVVLLASSAPAAGQTFVGTSRADQYLDPKDGLTMDALVTMAINKAPSLAAARARIEAARGDRQQAALRPNPSASVEQREQFGGIETQTAISLAWPLDLFRRGPRVAVADDAIRIAESWADDEVRQWASMVRERATDVLAALRQLTIADDRARFAKTRTDLLAARVDAGAARPLDRDLADVESHRAQADVIAWHAAADRAMAALKASVGLAADVPLRLAAPLSDVAFALPPPPLGDDMSARPDVKAKELEVSRAEAEVRRATSDSRFDLGLYAAYMTRRLDLAPERRMHEAAVGATVSLPWRNRQQGAIASAGAMRRAAEFSAAAHHLDARAEIDAARIRDLAATQSLALYRGGVMDLAARNLAVMRESFDLGRGTLLDVIDEERRYLELESAYTAVLREVIDARTALLRALGVTS